MGAVSFNAVLDSSIIIDLLNELPQAAAIPELFPSAAISVVTWIEVLVGAENAGQESSLRQFLLTYQILELTPEISDETIKVRRERRLKLPDAVIFATAQANSVPLVTRNTKDFRPDDPQVIVPYQL